MHPANAVRTVRTEAAGSNPNLIFSVEHLTMNAAFYLVPVGGGDHVYASNILSECIEMALYFTRVEIVDMFGQVWWTTNAG